MSMAAGVAIGLSSASLSRGGHISGDQLIEFVGFGSIAAAKLLVALMILSIPSFGYYMWREEADLILVVMAAALAPMFVAGAWSVLAAAGHGLIWIFGA
jgi:hypothetical protein